MPRVSVRLVCACSGLAGLGASDLAVRRLLLRLLARVFSFATIWRYGRCYDGLRRVEGRLRTRVPFLSMLLVEVGGVDFGCSQHHGRVELHVLEVAQGLLQALRCLLEGLVRRLDDVEGGGVGKVGSLLVDVVVRGGYLGGVDRGHAGLHHGAHLHLLVAVDLMDQA